MLPVDLNDTAQVQELISHSWYDYSGGKNAALHPYRGETTPRYSGPTSTYTNLDLDAEYSWLKSPRWRGFPMEVGPLARVLMMFATGNTVVQDTVNAVLTDLKLPLTALFCDPGPHRRARYRMQGVGGPDAGLARTSDEQPRRRGSVGVR